MAKKMVLIDGHSIMHRAFYGVPDLTNSAGTHTNAVYGFLNILFKLLDEEQPEYLAVAFDVHAPTFRHKMYEAYKGTRKPMPEELREQIPIIKELLSAMGILVMQQEGYEADDILGTMAKRAAAEGIKVSLISGDRDLLQIADEKILIRIPKTKAGRTQIEDYDTKRLMEEYHVTPAQFIELKALMGDASDNIPGVPKVGEKTAISLMESYGSIASIYEHLEEISKNAIRESLRENRRLCDLSLRLATIETDAPIDYRTEDTVKGELFTPQAYEWVKKLEFKNLLGRFDDAVKKKEMPGLKCSILRGRTEAKAVFDKLSGAGSVAFMLFEGKHLGLCGDEESYLMLTEEVMPLMAAVGMATGKIDAPFLSGEMQKLKKAFDDKGKKLITFDVKKAYGLFEDGDSEEDLLLYKSFTDTKLMAYLVNPLRKEYTPEDVAGEYLSIMAEDYKQQFGKQDMLAAASGESEKLSSYAATLLHSVLMSAQPLEKALDESGQTKLYESIEMPLTFVLYSMEKEGILVNASELKNYSASLGEKIEELQKSIFEQVGVTFNLNSPKQLGEILFEKLGLKGGKKTKTGYSTAADVLEKLAVDNKVVRDILEYRALAKLKSTYADGLGAFIGEDGRIHTSFNQMITATGRISSTDPNLQNIPTRTEMGRMIRKVFIPADGCVFVDADYSQIELRLLAHMSGDKDLIEAYRQSEDIHAITASKVFHVPLSDVTSQQRRNAKAVNFGIVYGISSFGLSQDLSISRSEAQEYISEYFNTYPGIKEYLDGAVASAKEKGESRTLYGRRRPIPELSNSNFMQRQFGERVAMNAPIQGSAADIMKIAMIRVFEAIKKAGLKSRILLQVHDELLIETRKDEEEEIRKILADNMKGAAELAVELEIDIHSGSTWYEAK